ncbi:MAG: hypothetical protein NTV73_06680 [Hyphomicrobiales bacterium]|nr:hypothetical protein [Hyphomicrobiales bacterium]
MEVTDDEPTSFYIHTLAATDHGIALRQPERIDIAPGDTAPIIRPDRMRLAPPSS